MTEKVVRDGRTARRERNQATVLDAVVELFDAGHLKPAVDEVAAWSGVSTRSIYRYFNHRPGLIAAALWHLVDRVDADLSLDASSAGHDERIGRFVEHRLAAYDRLAPLTRAARRAVSLAAADDDEHAATAERADDVVVARSIFSTSATDWFAAEFARLPDEGRRRAEVAAEMALQFDALEFLHRAFAGDRTEAAAVLEGHLRQHVPAESGR